MSLNHLLSPNTYEIYANSMHSSANTNSIFANFIPNSSLSLSIFGVTPIVMTGSVIANSNYNTSNGQYTVPVSGIYRFDVTIGNLLTVTGSVNSVLSINLLINGNVFRTGSNQVITSTNFLNDITFNGTIFLNKGDVISIQSQPPSPNTNISAYQAYFIDSFFSGYLLA